MIRRMARSITGAPIDLTQDRDTSNRVLWVSMFPLVVFALLTASTAIDLFHDAKTPGIFSDSLPAPFWRHAYYFFSDAQQALLPFTLALLFFFGIERVTHREGSWYLVIGATMALVGLVLRSAIAVEDLMKDPFRSDQYDWRLDIFASYGATALALSVGYAFLAYRGLSTHDYGRRVYGRRRRRPQLS
jgi:hypothetical protein